MPISSTGVGLSRRRLLGRCVRAHGRCPSLGPARNRAVSIVSDAA
jgi:hypothetical protein